MAVGLLLDLNYPKSTVSRGVLAADRIGVCDYVPVLPTFLQLGGQGLTCVECVFVPRLRETGLVLDGTKKEVENSSQPLFFFMAEDIKAARDFLALHGIEIQGRIENIGSVSFLVFRDPENNLLTVCQPN